MRIPSYADLHPRKDQSAPSSQLNLAVYRDPRPLRFRRPPRQSSASQMAESQIIASRSDKATDVGGRAADQGKAMSKKRALGSAAEQREHTPRADGKPQPPAAWGTQRLILRQAISSSQKAAMPVQRPLLAEKKSRRRRRCTSGSSWK